MMFFTLECIGLSNIRVQVRIFREMRNTFIRYSSLTCNSQRSDQSDHDTRIRYPGWAAVISIIYFIFQVLTSAALCQICSLSQALLYRAHRLHQTQGHFACACVHPQNDNSVGASNLMAGNRKLARKVTVLLKAISLVLWIPYFPTKNVIHDKNRTFSTRVFSCRFSAVGFLNF